MSFPESLRYTAEHEWVRLESDGSVTIGITHHAQDALGDVVYVELPEVGDTLEEGAIFGVVESVKTASDLFSPLAGEVLAVNETLADQPQQVNQDPYGAAWMLRLQPSDPAAYEALMDAEAYRTFVTEIAG